MEEKIILSVRQNGAKLAAIAFGIAVAAIVLCICLSIFDPAYYTDTSLLGAAACGVVAGVVVYMWLSKMELVISDKRVYGAAGFGKRVDLPLDSITAIGTGWFKTVSVTTPSGAIKFMLMPNHIEIHATISKLLIERQKQPTPTVIPTQGSTADEMKKYKDLLDSGVITQEEFDAKKKQLLGL